MGSARRSKSRRMICALGSGVGFRGAWSGWRRGVSSSWGLVVEGIAYQGYCRCDDGKPMIKTAGDVYSELEQRVPYAVMMFAPVSRIIGQSYFRSPGGQLGQKKQIAYITNVIIKKRSYVIDELLGLLQPDRHHDGGVHCPTYTTPPFDTFAVFPGRCSPHGNCAQCFCENVCMLPMVISMIRSHTTRSA